MSGNCFLKQEATLDILSNVASFCAECYVPISENEIIFYDMNNYRYLCSSCQEIIQEKLTENCESIDGLDNSLFS
jgi:hypothetical protein